MLSLRYLSKLMKHKQHLKRFHVSSQDKFPTIYGDVLKIKDKLVSAIGSDFVVSSSDICSTHGQDKGPEKGKAPDIVVYPSCAAEVSEICKYCHEDRVPIIPYGTGTGLEGGISAIHGGVCIDMSRMNAILDYNKQDMDVAVEPGVTGEMLNQYVKNDGLWFSVDTSASASICGMCATGATGTNTIRYGSIKENCINLEVVLADGRIIHTVGPGKRPRKNSAGFNLTSLLIGSEGTLGVITRATVKLHGLPNHIMSAVVSFSTVRDAVNTVINTLQYSVPMAKVELLDEAAIKASNQYSKLSNPEQPTLFMEFHASENVLEEQTRLVEEIAERNGGINFVYASKQEERNKLWTARRHMMYAILALRPECRSIVTDVCVPLSALADLIQQSKEDILKCEITGAIESHVGDGNFHAFLLFDPNNQEEYNICKKISERMAIRALKLGGSCSGEHGIGIEKMGLLKEQIGNTGVDVMKQLKTALDPMGIMNPGKIFI